MAFLLTSEEWIKALMEVVNTSEVYAEAGREWEGDFYLIVEPAGQFTDTLYFYIDLWHGKCREAYLSPDGKEKNPEFRISAPITSWIEIVEGRLDAVQGMLSRRLKVQGNLLKITRHVRAAKALVDCCSSIPTEYPVI
jgi:putative sterol carrier protein